MHVSSGCLFDERINSTPYHELMFTPQTESKSTSQDINQALFRCIETDKPTNGSQRQSSRRWRYVYKEFKLLEFLTLCTKNQTAVTSVLDTLNPIESLKQGALN